MSSGKAAFGRAIVAGGGVGGLAAAAALSPRFQEVVVVEKDRVPPVPAIRKGVAQGAHVHVLLNGGERALEALLPSIREDFLAAGAVIARSGIDNRFFDFGAWRPRRDFGSTMLCLTRPSFEHAIRKRVAAIPNVTIVEGARVEHVAFVHGRASGLVVRLDSGLAQSHAANFVVDARGRGGALVRELTKVGFSPPPVDIIGIDMSYATGRFKKPAPLRGSAESLLCVPSPPDNHYALLSPIENEEWIVSLCGRGDLAPPIDLNGFLDFAGRLAAPEIRERLDGATLAAPIRTYRKPTASWRRYERLERFPLSFAPLGDTISSFNPVYGQGMTVAARHALALGAALDEHSPNDPAFAARYFEKALEATADAWFLASTVDLAYPDVTGERPADFKMQQAFRFGLRWLADEDESIHRLMNDILQMTQPPSALRNIAIVARAMAKARERGWGGA
ncbi:MAG: hypothetical protein WD076_10000 [Parvularculaceae bacterium]